jgi:sodium-dependent phosphate transporter
MCCVCLCVGLWLLLATYLELPVSTTHSAVGGIVGFTLVAVGSDCVVWAGRQDGFPFVRGVSAIVMSWVFSPVLSGALGALIYFITRRFVLRVPNSTERALLTYPILVAFCVCICVFYITTKGARSINALWDFDSEGERASSHAAAPRARAGEQTSAHRSPARAAASLVCAGEDLWLTVVISFGAAGIAAALSLLLKSTIRATIDETPEEDEEPTKVDEVAADVPPAEEKTEKKGVLAWLQKNLDTDVDDLVAGNAKVKGIHDQAEKFPRKTEVVFKYMQVMTAAFDSFAHGANDVANAMGPFMAVWAIYTQNGVFSRRNEIGPDAFWILAIGGAGIVMGLGVYGYKIMFTLGLKLAKVTPSRGFSIELGSMLVILTASRFGIPLSTTHSQIGSTIGVSMMEGKASSTNWTVVLKAVTGWIFTMIVAGTLTAAVFAIGYATIPFDPSQQLSPGWQGN